MYFQHTSLFWFFTILFHGCFCVLDNFYFKVTGVGYSAEGEITTAETYLNQGRLVEQDVVADYSNHPSIRKVVEVVESRFFSVSPLHLAYFLGLVYYKQMH